MAFENYKSMQINVSQFISWFCSDFCSHSIFHLMHTHQSIYIKFYTTAVPWIACVSLRAFSTNVFQFFFQQTLKYINFAERKLPASEWNERSQELSHANVQLSNTYIHTTSNAKVFWMTRRKMVFSERFRVSETEEQSIFGGKWVRTFILCMTIEWPTELITFFFHFISTKMDIMSRSYTFPVKQFSTFTSSCCGVSVFAEQERRLTLKDKRTIYCNFGIRETNLKWATEKGSNIFLNTSLFFLQIFPHGIYIHQEKNADWNFTKKSIHKWTQLRFQVLNMKKVNIWWAFKSGLK